VNVIHLSFLPHDAL